MPKARRERVLLPQAYAHYNRRAETYTFRNGRIDEIRPLIWWGLRGCFFHPFWYGIQITMDLVDGAASSAQVAMHRFGLVEVLGNDVMDLPEFSGGGSLP